jgi:3-deoxy-D-manno-octulosonate 8-phosphate phosphatase KdsC-like HAD superfamily phosphatase
VYLDPAYRYSIRAYRYNGRRTASLTETEIRSLLKDARLDRLTSISRAADTYIVQQNVDKGAAVNSVRRYLGCSRAAAAAIGESTLDLAMLTAVEHAYAPANCSPALRALAKENKCKMMRRGFQSGLLEAVEHHIGKRAVTPDKDGLNPTSMMRMFLRAADRPFALQLAATLFWWNR